jgi:UDP-glucose 4-epimerase
VVVTGGDGFLGRPLVRELASYGAEVLVVDDGRLGREPAPTPPGGDRLWADFRSAEARGAIADFGPQTLFHLAAMHFVPQCDADPAGCLDTNVLGTERLLGTLRETGLESLVFCSSAVVYGFSDRPRKETDPLEPKHVYAQSKLLGEGLLRGLHEDRPGVRTVAARLFNLVGPGDTAQHVVPVVVDAVTSGRTLHLGNTWPQRDYIHVADVASALVALADGPAGSTAVNVGTGVGRSVADIISVVEGVTGRPVTVERDPARERATDGHLVADVAKITAETTWRPRFTFEQTIRQLLDDSGAS